MKPQREYKDRLFRFRFGNKEYIEDTLALYNALNNTTHTDASKLQITTIDDVLYMSMKNDVSFIINNTMSLWEHQSSVNPNMPLRGLVYFAKLYEKHYVLNNEDAYSDTKVKLPTPQYIVFYNGTKSWAKKELKLSDLFYEKDKGCLECIATVYNINKDSELLNACKPLMEYTTFVQLVRKYNSDDGYSLEESIERATDECIKNNCMADFLKAHRAEVRGMILTEYDEQKHLENVFKRGEEKGLIEGEKKGEVKGIVKLINVLRDMALTEKRIFEVIQEQYPDVNEGIILELMRK